MSNSAILLRTELRGFSMQVVCACVLALQKYHECWETALPVSKPCKYIYDFWFILQKANSGNIAEVVARLAKTPLPKGWPVPLTLGCNVDGSTSAPSTDRIWRSWLHGAMDKTTASSLLASKSSGKDGAFFVRSRGTCWHLY